eukprot:scaffold98695_cov57-Phaeocystis_antarctica.AAC.2
MAPSWATLPTNKVCSTHARPWQQTARALPTTVSMLSLISRVPPDTLIAMPSSCVTSPTNLLCCTRTLPPRTTRPPVAAELPSKRQRSIMAFPLSTMIRLRITSPDSTAGGAPVETVRSGAVPSANNSAPPSPISRTSLAVVPASNVSSGVLPLSLYVPFAMWMTTGRPVAFDNRAHCSASCNCCEQTPPSLQSESTRRGVAGGGGDGGELGGARGGGGRFGGGGEGGEGGHKVAQRSAEQLAKPFLSSLEIAPHRRLSPSDEQLSASDTGRSPTFVAKNSARSATKRAKS